MCSTLTTMVRSATTCSLSPSGFPAKTTSRTVRQRLKRVVDVTRRIVVCRVLRTAFILAFLNMLPLAGCVTQDGYVDDVGQTDSMVRQDATVTPGDSDVQDDHGDTEDASQAFVCRRPAGRDWDRFELEESGGLNPPVCYSWILERSLMRLTYPDSSGAELTSIMPADRFAEIDCIVSSVEFQGMMAEGFACSDTQVIDSYISFSLTSSDGINQAQDVTPCVYDSQNPNLARELAGRIRGWNIEVPE